VSKKIDKIFSFVLFLVIVGWLIFHQKNVQETLVSEIQESDILALTPVPTSTAGAALEFAVADTTAYTFIATVSGQNALELVQSQVQLELKKYDFGVMIEGVNGLMADNKHYWALYLNDAYAQLGIADIQLQENDKLELKYEEITL